VTSWWGPREEGRKRDDVVVLEAPKMALDFSGMLASLEKKQRENEK